MLAMKRRDGLRLLPLPRRAMIRARRCSLLPARSIRNPAGRKAGIAQVTAVRTWNAENYTRIVVDLGDSVKYEAARIANPDRIFFDLYQAKIDVSLQNKTFDVKSGFLKSVRLAQNKSGVVRLVLDVESVREYSAYLLKNPPRLVIDVHGDAYDRRLPRSYRRRC